MVTFRNNNMESNLSKVYWSCLVEKLRFVDDGVLVIFVLLTHPNLMICFLRGQAEREFKVEVEAIGRVRHKNLVRLLGYCAEGNQRYLI
jgi:hypothetical protein